MAIQPDDIGYEATIGLEVHVQLNTESKIFGSDANAESEAPNMHVNPISWGHPGTLPVLNQSVLEKALTMGLACEAEIPKVIFFDRKHYFYPDLPKGYQTTQDQAPISKGGFIALPGENRQKAIALHHMHMEDDAGKSIHDLGDFTAIDLNRAGTPLIEIVTEPCIKTAEEASALLQEIRRIVRYLGISSAHMEKGEMRCDANISIKPKDAKQLGAKVEIKNMNSFAHVRKAIAYELERQTILVKQGKAVLMETRTFHPNTGETEGMRFKETLNDYRYFPCPDLPPVHVKEGVLNVLRAKAKFTPAWYRNHFAVEYDLNLNEVNQLTEQYETAFYFHTLSKLVKQPKKAAHFILGSVRKYLNEKKVKLSEDVLSSKKVAELLNMQEEGRLTSQVVNDVILPQMFESKQSVTEMVNEQKLWVVKDENLMSDLIDDVLQSHPKEVVAYQKGKKKLFGMFMGEAMKKGKGNLDAGEVRKFLIEKLK